MALILATASRRVESASGFAGLSKPTWLSLICRKVSWLAARALAASALARLTERGKPPLSIQRTPVPAQVMHSRKPRRSMPSSSSEEWFGSLRFVMVESSASRFGLQCLDSSAPRFIPDNYCDHRVMVGAAHRARPRLEVEKRGRKSPVRRDANGARGFVVPGSVERSNGAPWTITGTDALGHPARRTFPFVD